MEVEINGIVFTELGDTWEVLDLSYDLVLGYIELYEGPGWILNLNDSLLFLDYGQLNVITAFIERRNMEKLDAE